jgi:hypothetical protein
LIVLAADSEGYADHGLMADAPYRYIVEAFNASGSGFSEDVEIRTWSRIDVWRLAKFGTLVNAGDAADDGDWDYDGTPNLMEYALGTDPADEFQGGTAWTLHLRDGVQIGTNRFLTAIYHLGPDAAPGMTVMMGVSTNLMRPWEINMVPVDEILTGGLRRLRVRSDQPLGARREEYLRMTVTPDLE